MASRAESDGLALFSQDEKAVRNAAASSALDYAQLAEKLGDSSVEARAQLDWHPAPAPTCTPGPSSVISRGTPFWWPWM